MPMDRRSFITGSASLGAAVATGAVASLALADENESEKVSGEKGSAEAATSAPASDVPAWLGAEPEIADSDIVETKETTLLIIGAGTAGLACAATAVDMGLDFFLAEKLPIVAESRAYFGAVATAQQTEAGIEFDKGMLLNELSRYASGKCDRDLIKMWIDESAEAAAWITPMFNAVGSDMIVPDYREEQAGGTLYYSPVTEMMSSTFYIPPTRNDVIYSHIQQGGQDVAFGYEMVRLVHGDAGVTGAIFETEDGYVQVNAKYTVIATGGYAANADMMMALQPDSVACTVAAGYYPSCNGSGIKAGIWAGGTKDYEPTPMIFDRGAVEPGVDAGYEDQGNGKYAFRGTISQIDIASQPFMKVNRNGKRFANESTPYDNIIFAAGRQPGGVYCQVFDGNAKEDIIRFRSTGCAAVARLFMENGGDIDSYFDYIGCTIFKKADTLDELADMLGFEGEAKDNFLATAENYNAMYDAQEDTEYGKEAYRLSELRTPPFYGCWFGGTLLTTLDGLRINSSLEVLDENLQPVPGLYAIGDASGSFFANNYPEYIVGVAAGRSTVEGRHLAKQIAAAEGIDVEAADNAAMEALLAAVTEEPPAADYVANGAVVAW